MSAQLAVLADELAVQPRRMGRPSIYTPELAQEICEAIAQGGHVHKLCVEREHWPHESTVYDWVYERRDFSEMFTRARQRKAHRFVDETAAIADGDGPDVRRDELKIKTRQWIATKLHREAYGDQAPQQANVTVNVAQFSAAAEQRLRGLLERLDPIDVTPNTAT